MSVSDDFRERIERMLSAAAPVTSRAMFGGVGVYSDRLFFALIDNDILYFKVDDTNRRDFEERGMKPFAPFGDHRVMQYYRVPDEVLDDSTELRQWVAKALAVARHKAKKTRPKKR